MATEVKIPHLGHTMTEAKILRWFKEIGDPIDEGETLLEIETEKVNYEIESPINGFVIAIFASVGETIPPGTTAAMVGEAGEEIDISRYEFKTTEKSAGITMKTLKPEILEPISEAVEPSRTRIITSPAAKKLAKKRGVDLSLIKGSGLSGRIRLSDIEKCLDELGSQKVEKDSVSGIEVTQVIPMSNIRQIIAKKLTKSSQESPHFNLCTEIDMTKAKELIFKMKQRNEQRGEMLISLNDIFIKSVAVTLRDYPRLNSRLNGNRIEILRDINIGLAVALDEGLIVPAIEQADKKRIAQLAQERKDLVERARNGRLSLSEIERGTFTVSNLGGYGITFFTSIINPPQSAILSIAKIIDRPVVHCSVSKESGQI